MSRVLLVMVVCLLVLTGAHACIVDAECIASGAAWCDGNTRCNGRGRCETRPRCTNPALPYCVEERQACLDSSLPIATPTRSKSMLALSTTDACTTDACCVQQVHVAYRTVGAGETLPWCIQAAHVSDSGVGCELVERCSEGDECDEAHQRCSRARLRIAIVDVCFSDAECSDGVFCNGDELCNVGGSCEPALDGPCAGNTSFPACDEVTQECHASAAPSGASTLLIWIVVTVIITTICCVLCVAVLFASTRGRGYIAVERPVPVSTTYAAPQYAGNTNAALHAGSFSTLGRAPLFAKRGEQ